MTNSAREEESADVGVIKPSAVVTLDSLHASAELSRDIRKKSETVWRKYQISAAMERSIENASSRQG